MTVATGRHDSRGFHAINSLSVIRTHSARSLDKSPGRLVVKSRAACGTGCTPQSTRKIYRAPATSERYSRMRVAGQLEALL
jgi:hypothetical protein